ncbi:MAG TPA: hypothetical protein VFR08_01565, partial [Candidatus Angelobacter sp.]|nr:hypothetical protein [Candidatus Angelobacter sp.]
MYVDSWKVNQVAVSGPQFSKFVGPRRVETWRKGTAGRFEIAASLLVRPNKINERGQISGMAIVLSGPDAGNVHAFLATPVNQSLRRPVADVVHTHPKSNLPANVGQQLLPRLQLGSIRG